MDLQCDNTGQLLIFTNQEEKTDRETVPDKLCLGTSEEKHWTKAEIPKFSQDTVLCLRLALDRNKYLLVSCSKQLD